MNKSQAIRLKCLDCMGDSPKEVTLCHIVDCSLWPIRFGYSMKDKRFNKRMGSAKKKYPKDYQEMVSALLEYLQDVPNLREKEHIRAVLGRKVA